MMVSNKLHNLGLGDGESDSNLGFVLILIAMGLVVLPHLFLPKRS